MALSSKLKDAYQNVNITITPDKIILKNKQGVFEKPLTLTLNDIRKQIERIGFHKPYNSTTYDLYFSEAVEKSNLLYINFIYYLAFYENLKVPTLMEVTSKYLEMYCERVGNSKAGALYKVKPLFVENSITFTSKEITGRIFRAYNSFHRELELFFQLREFKDLYVEYDFQKDLHGIDFTVLCNEKEFGIASYVNTRRSTEWKNVKDTFRHDYSKLNMIDIIAVMSANKGKVNCYNRKGVYTYSPVFIKEKYQEILELSK